jgi:hypothetical protein
LAYQLLSNLILRDPQTWSAKETTLEDTRQPTRTKSTAGSGSSGLNSGDGETAGQPFGTTSASETASPGASTASRVLDQAHDVAGQIKDTATEKAHSLFDSQKGRVVETGNALTTALRQTASSLRQQDQSELAGYIEQATSKVEAIARNLEQKDLDRILWDVQNFARRSPAVFFGATFAIGFIASRFLKSSGDRTATRMGFDPARRYDYGYERGLYGSAFDNRNFDSPYTRNPPRYDSGYGTSPMPMGSSGRSAGYNATLGASRSPLRNDPVTPLEEEEV